MKEQLNEILIKLYHEVKNLDNALTIHPVKDRNRVLVLKMMLCELESEFYHVESSKDIKVVLESFYLKVIQFQISQKMALSKKDLFNMVQFIDQSVFASQVYHTLFSETEKKLLPIWQIRLAVRKHLKSQTALAKGKIILINGTEYIFLTPFLGGADYWLTTNSETNQTPTLMRLEDLLITSKGHYQITQKNSDIGSFYPFHLN